METLCQAATAQGQPQESPDRHAMDQRCRWRVLSARGVRLAVSDGQIAIETDNPDLGDGRELLDAKLKGTPITIGFSGRYLIDVLQEVQSPEVRISLGNDLDPAMIAPVDDGKDGNRALFVIMPMRL